MADKIKCPIHGNELALEKSENLLVAICNCNVPNNPYKGKRVHQRPAIVASTSIFTKEASVPQNKKGVN